MLRKNAAVAVLSSLMFAAASHAEDTSIRPFRVNVSEEALVDLRQRIAATRWPEKELVNDASRACSSRRCRSSPATGAASTTGARARHG